jgi:hypothetical protein
MAKFQKKTSLVDPLYYTDKKIGPTMPQFSSANSKLNILHANKISDSIIYLKHISIFTAYLPKTSHYYYYDWSQESDVTKIPALFAHVPLTTDMKGKEGNLDYYTYSDGKKKRLNC